MLDAYGRAVVEERRKPHYLEGLAAYVRLEYPRGTDPAYLLAEVAGHGPRRRRGSNRLRGPLWALLRIAGALLRRRQRGERAEHLQPVR